MTFEEMFQQAKELLSKASVGRYDGTVVAQINITGDGSGIFYVKADVDNLAIEPYDYKDHDVLIEADSKLFLDALKNAETLKLPMEGELEKIAAFQAVLSTLPLPKKAAAKKAAAKPAAAKKAEPKAAASAAKKTETKAAAAKKAPAKTTASKTAASGKSTGRTPKK